jgi:methionyl-tRNA formyltransferase
MTTKTIKIKKQADETEEELKARALLNPKLRGAITIDAYTINGMGADISTLVATLEQQCKGDNFDAKEMLIAQAQTLDCLFHNLAYNASLNLAKNTAAAETLLKLAFRAQNQSGKTLQVILQNELLNEVKDSDSVDTSKAIEALEGDKTVATLFAIDGGKVSRRKG